MHALARGLTLKATERRPGRLFAAVGLVFAVMYVTALTAVPRDHRRIVDGDTIQYYAYLRSLVLDGDLDFANDYRLLYSRPDSGATDNIWLTSTTPIGRAPNLMSIGPALLWAPFFLATYVLLLVLRPLGITVPLDGIAAPFPLSAGIAGIFYAAFGAYFTYRTCRLLFPHGAALWAALVAWLATPAVYYSLVSPAYSHAPSLCASAVFCYVWLKTRDEVGVRRHFWLGLLAGVAALVRWQDVIILALPLVELVRSVAKRQQGVTAAALRAAAMISALAIMLLPQLMAWRAIYGQFFVMPQGEGFMRWGSPAVFSLLFSLRHGLFSWTPAVLLAAAGLFLRGRRDALLGWSSAIVVLLAVYVNASVSDWWAGEAFGARRFVGYTVFFALGLAAFFSTKVWRNRPALLGLTAVAIITYNLLFLLQYQLFMRGFDEVVPYPTTVRQVLFDRLILPFELLRLWIARP